MFARGCRVAVAVSGGADSVALLHLLAELAPRWDLSLCVLHLDHGLRGEDSRRDAAYVRELAGGLGLAARLEQADVAGEAHAAGENLEQAARRRRLAFFGRAMVELGLNRVALGHTRDDQAETVLFRLLRGSGPAGLSGIWPATAEGIVRPLIEVRRQELVEYLRRGAIRWREDVSNRDPRFARNRIRHELLPRLGSEWNPEIGERLADLARLAREDEEYWQAEIDRLASRLLVHRGGGVMFQASAVASLPPAVAGRLVRRAIGITKGNVRRIDYGHIGRALELARQPAGVGRLELPGVTVARSFDWVRLEAGRRPAGGEYEVAVPVPGRLAAPGTGVVLRFELDHGKSAAEPGYNQSGNELSWDRLGGSLQLRNWRPGDQYTPVGHPRAESVKTLLQEARIPLWDRRIWPIITHGGQIVWTRRFGAAEEYAARGARRVLRVVEEADGAAARRFDEF